MKNLLYILFAVSLLTVSCSGLRNSSQDRAEREFMKREDVRKAIESQQMIIKVDRIYADYGRMVDIHPRNNFLIIDRNRTRVSLAYIGKSFSIRPVAAINFSGKVESGIVDTNADGSYDLSFELGQENEKFDVSMNVTSTGYVNMTVANPRIDFVRYSGTLESL